MIKLQKYTPQVYYEQSRDFQFIGRLYDIVLNAIKTNADTMYNLPVSKNINSKLVDLITLSLGFTSKHEYNINQLMALCSIFPTLLKNKGNINSIEMLGNVLAGAEGITEKFSCSIDRDNPTNLTLAVPIGISDKTLLRDLLDYVLPAGMTCSIISEVVTKKATTISTIADHITIYAQDPQMVSKVVTKIPDTEKLTGNIGYSTVLTTYNDTSTDTTQVFPEEGEKK